MKSLTAGLLLAALALGACGARAGAKITAAERKRVAPLLKSLTSQDPRTRRNTVLKLGRAGKRARGALPEMLKVVRDKNEGVAAAAALALAQIAPDDEQTLRALQTCLGDSRPAVRGNAAKGLGLLGARAAGATAALIAALSDASTSVRCRAARALGGIKPAGPAVIAALRGALGQTSGKDAWKVRQAAAQALGDIGPKAVDAADALAKAVEDPRKAVRDAALGALRRIGRAAVPALEDLFGHANPDVRRTAVRQLSKMRPASNRALGRALVHKNTDVNKVAALVMGLRGDALVAAVAKVHEAEKKEKEAAAAVKKEIEELDEELERGGEDTPEAKAKREAEKAAGKQCRSWLSMARNFASNKMPAQAREYLAKIKEKHPGTEWAKQADQMLAELDAAPRKEKKKPEK